MRFGGRTGWRWRPAGVLAAVAVCLGALAPVLGALHAASHEAAPAGAVGGVSACSHGGAGHETPEAPSDRSPRKRAPHHECPICLQLTSAMRQATPAEGAAPDLAPVALGFAPAPVAAGRAVHAVRPGSRPRAPPTGASTRA